MYLYLLIPFWEMLAANLESWRLEFALKFVQEHVLTLSTECITLLSKIRLASELNWASSTTPEEFEIVAIFIQLGLLFTLIGHTNTLPAELPFMISFCFILKQMYHQKRLCLQGGTKTELFGNGEIWIKVGFSPWRGLLKSKMDGDCCAKFLRRSADGKQLTRFQSESLGFC